MERKVLLTRDGSATIAIDAISVTYHSRHGALQESRHVFIEAGLQEAARRFPTDKLRVFEMGFGTGLNALLTAVEAKRLRRNVDYFAIENSPLTESEYATLNYAEPDLFMQLHAAAWDEPVMITENFQLHKMKGDVEIMPLPTDLHCIYYDAFAPSAQAHLWTEDAFRRMHALLVPGGLLVTYCSKSVVRRAMQSAGFTVEKLPGPKWKREILRATR